MMMTAEAEAQGAHEGSWRGAAWSSWCAQIARHHGADEPWPERPDVIAKMNRTGCWEYVLPAMDCGVEWRGIQVEGNPNSGGRVEKGKEFRFA
jgi:hypothetical protein